MRVVSLVLTLILAVSSLVSAQDRRPMTFLDMRLMKDAGAPAPSPDGRWMLYTVTTPDWKEAKSQQDVFLVSLQQGLPSTKQMTFTKEKNETSPKWAKDGRFFVFLSNREAPESAATRNQLYMMRPDGGEARRITEAKESVSDFAFSPDGKAIVYRSGKTGEEQLLPDRRRWNRNAGRRAGDEAGDGHQRRLEMVSRQSQYLLRVPRQRRSRMKKRAARSGSRSTSATWRRRSPACGRSTSPPRAANGSPKTPSIPSAASPSPMMAGGSASAAAPRSATSATSRRPISMPTCICSTRRIGQIERLTKNREVGEGQVTFSPDSQWLAFTAPDNVEKYSMTNGRVYLRSGRGPRASRSGNSAASFDGDAGGRVLVEGRRHDLLQRRRQGDEPAHGARRQERHRPAADQRKGLALGRPRRRHGRPAGHL